MNREKRDRNKQEDNTIQETTIFGERVGARAHRQGPNVMTGVLFVLTGLLLLANNSGLIPSSIWPIMAQYWPVFLILWGVQIMIGKGRIGSVVMTILSLVVVGTIVLIGIQETNPGLISQWGLDRLPWYGFINYLQLK